MSTEIEEFCDKHEKNIEPHSTKSLVYSYKKYGTMDRMWNACNDVELLVRILMCEKNPNYYLCLVRYISTYCLDPMIAHLKDDQQEYVKKVSKVLKSFAEGLLNKENLVKMQVEISSEMHKVIEKADAIEKQSIYGSHLALAWVATDQPHQATLHALSYSFNFLKSKEDTINRKQLDGFRKTIGNPYFFGGKRDDMRVDISDYSSPLPSSPEYAYSDS